MADLRAAADLLDRLFLPQPSGSQDAAYRPTVGSTDIWAWVHGLFLLAIYGGRVENPFDTDILDAYLRQIFNEALLTNRELGPLRLPSTANRKVGKKLVILTCV
ncbi:unnamed protein product [Protopolystoma xenopodis]|uniref:Dynein heavy chain AAA lid domain-containing protein n=1 Tax=Protopolystoma xenopodis TaxID=117903 RepID=A0A3S5A5C1_9PLAT|nr:unnamed protein product [Protopolystoma xenopodis]